MQQDSPLIRKALPGDATEISALAEALFRQSYGPTHPEPELSRYVTRTFSNEIFARDISDPGAVVLVAEGAAARSLIGYAVLRDGSPPNEQLVADESEHIEIVRFYVDPNWHGAGVAQALMTECVVEAERRGRKVIWLQAWQEAARALAFYRKMGFVVKGTAKFPFGERMDDDFLLVKEL